jgi:hypothetical protein
MTRPKIAIQVENNPEVTIQGALFERLNDGNKKLCYHLIGKVYRFKN